MRRREYGAARRGGVRVPRVRGRVRRAGVRRRGSRPEIGWPKKAGGALPSRDELKAASERLVNPLGRQKLSREERQQRTAERLAKQPTPTGVYGGGRRAGARAQPV